MLSQGNHRFPSGNVHVGACVCVMHATVTCAHMGDHGRVSDGETSTGSLLGMPDCPVRISVVAFSVLFQKY